MQGQLARVMCDVRALLGSERLRRRELAEAELEKRELLELLRDLQPTRSQIPAEQPTRSQILAEQPTRSQIPAEQPTAIQHREDPQPIWWEIHREEPMRHQQLEGFSQGINQSASPGQCRGAVSTPPSPLMGEEPGESSTRSVTLDCIKKKHREVTVI